MKKWLSLVLAVLMVFGMVSALAEETVNLRFAYWGSGAEKMGIEKAVAAFEETYPNIKVELMHIPDDFETKLNADIGHQHLQEGKAHKHPWQKFTKTMHQFMHFSFAGEHDHRHESADNP